MDSLRTFALIGIAGVLIWFGLYAMDTEQTGIVAWYVVAGAVGMSALIERIWR
jgi:hypothetical protein